MAIDFPSSPSVDDTFTVGDATYTFDGTKWSVNVTTSSAEITLTNDTTSTSNYYPTLADSITNPLEQVYVTDTKLYFQPSTGTLNANELNSLSDRRLKNNIQPLNSSLDKVLSLTGVSFTFKNTGKESIGLIAQEVNEILPEVVNHNEETDTMTVSYGNIVGLLIEAIKEQQIEIDKLKNKLGE